MKMNEQEIECLIRILLDKISKQEEEIQKLTSGLATHKSECASLYTMASSERDEKEKWQKEYDELEKKYDELHGIYNKALADIEDLKARPAEESARPDELADVIKYCMMSTRGTHPYHGQICLCLTTKPGCVISLKDFIVLKYNADEDCWVTNDGFCEVYKYGDFVVTYWMGVDKFLRHI